MTRQRLSLVLRIMLPAALTIVTLCCAIIGWRFYDDYVHIKSRLDRIEALASPGSGGGLGLETITGLRQEINGGKQDFARLKADVAWLMPVASHLQWLPKIGPTLRALPHVLAMGDLFFKAADVLFDGLDPLLKAMLGSDQGPSGSITERILPALILAQPHIVAAQDLLEQAATEREQIAALDVPSRLLSPLARLDRYLAAMRSASQLAAQSPLLLGAIRPMTYLILAQNNDELRPTGGFISAIGILTLDKGRITRLEFKDGYAVDNWSRDHPAPPEPLLRYMDSQLWVFRDSNFWPDFPTSARAAEFFAQLDLDLQPDGVIAVDQFALQILVDSLGSLTIPDDNNAVLTADNTIAKIRAYWKPHTGTGISQGGLEAWSPQRKQYIATIFETIRARIEHDTRSINLARLGRAVLRALDERHVLLYLHQAGGWLTSGANWGAAIAQTDDDYLFVVDTNMGFNKVNGIIHRSIDYSVVIDDSGLAQARVTITYQNPSTRVTECIHESYYEATYDLMMNRCYWNYLRIYVPAGATLIDDGNLSYIQLAETEAGKRVWARWLVVPTQSSQTVTVSYYLPQPVLRQAGDKREYRLLVQKQAGTDSTPLHVKVTLPPQTRVLTASPAPKRLAGNVVEFEAPLQKDEQIRILVE